MLPATRSRTAADSTNDEASTTGATPDDPPDAESATHVDAGTGSRSATDTTAAPGPGPPTPPISSGRQGVWPPLRVKEVEAVADDIASTARRPDAVLYWGGVARLAALIILERLAATAVGVAVERRRVRPHRATT